MAKSEFIAKNFDKCQNIAKITILGAHTSLRSSMRSSTRSFNINSTAYLTLDCTCALNFRPIRLLWFAVLPIRIRFAAYMAAEIHPSMSGTSFSGITIITSRTVASHLLRFCHWYYTRVCQGPSSYSSSTPHKSAVALEGLINLNNRVDLAKRTSLYQKFPRRLCRCRRE